MTVTVSYASPREVAVPELLCCVPGSSGLGTRAFRLVPAVRCPQSATKVTIPSLRVTANSRNGDRVSRRVVQLTGSGMKKKDGEGVELWRFGNFCPRDPSQSGRWPCLGPAERQSCLHIRLSAGPRAGGHTRPRDLTRLCPLFCLVEGVSVHLCPRPFSGRPDSGPCLGLSSSRGWGLRRQSPPPGPGFLENSRETQPMRPPGCGNEGRGPC